MCKIKDNNAGDNAIMQSLYIGATGMKTHSSGLSIVSQNISNVNTVGFKQQLMLFDNLMSENLPSPNATNGGMNQVGMGVHIGAVRTSFNQGAFETTANYTEVALAGKGFFQVSDEKGSYYTRAGNFSFDSTGTLRSPDGKNVTGIPFVDGVESGQLGDIVLNMDDVDTVTDPSKATTSMKASMNIFTDKDTFADPNDPYFAMLKSWDGTNSPPLNGAESLALQFYDANGVKQSLTVNFDSAPAVNGDHILEYTISMDPSLDARPEYADSKSAGLLMAGTMSFSSVGELKNMSSFSPTGGDLTDLNNWQLSTLENGLPSINLQLAGLPPQKISLNIGMSGDGNWVNAKNEGLTAGGLSAAELGTDVQKIPGMTTPTFNSQATTGLKTNSSLKSLNQDGYPEGDLANLNIDNDGIIHATYTNGQTHPTYRIPVFRFTSEDGLRREGNNLYAYTDDAGTMEHGVAGTENYGKIMSNRLEISNVDMSREMVNMMIVQRGFQTNSKALQTADSMIQKALEIKR